MLSRPDDLPDFARPPIVEAVMSVQFATPPGYNEIYAREVWALFERDFPRVQEKPALEPFFEVFGAGPTGVQIKLQRVAGAFRNRYWFLGPADRELIQFQHDRFIHNWRKLRNTNDEYPRFEPILEKFKSELGAIESYFGAKGWGPLAPNQCELIYVNRMALVGATNAAVPLSYFFRRLDVSMIGDASEFAVNLHQVLAGPDGQSPTGRLYVEAKSHADATGKREVLLNLTARGAPATADIAGATQFLINARERVVRTFAEITSDEAHKLWERRQ